MSGCLRQVFTVHRMCHIHCIDFGLSNFFTESTNLLLLEEVLIDKSYIHIGLKKRFIRVAYLTCNKFTLW